MHIILEALPLNTLLNVSYKCTSFNIRPPSPTPVRRCAHVRGGGSRLVLAEGGQLDVRPAGEERRRVPLALPVAQEHSKRVP